MNGLQSALLLCAMAGLAGYLGWTLVGRSGVVWALLAVAIILATGPARSPRFVLRLAGAALLPAPQAPELHALVAQLSARARLPRVPQIYFLPSRALNAFAVGRRRDPAIAVTEGLLRALEPRELAAVLAHEIAHVRANDVSVMSIADVVGRMTRVLSTLGAVLLAVLLPVAAASGLEIELLPIAVMVLAPVGFSVLQLALARTRELDADLAAVELTGDPHSLATALEKLDRLQGAWVRRALASRAATMLSSHPDVGERIRRLNVLAAAASRD